MSRDRQQLQTTVKLVSLRFAAHADITTLYVLLNIRHKSSIECMILI